MLHAGFEQKSVYVYVCFRFVLVHTCLASPTKTRLLCLFHSPAGGGDDEEPRVSEADAVDDGQPDHEGAIGRGDYRAPIHYITLYPRILYPSSARMRVQRGLTLSARSGQENYPRLVFTRKSQ